MTPPRVADSWASTPGRTKSIERYTSSGGGVPFTAPGGELLNLGIGQGRLVVTPLQVARMVAAVANDGVLVPPKIVRELRPFGPATPAAEIRAEAVTSESNDVRCGEVREPERGGVADVQAIRIDPASALAHNNLGSALVARGDRDRAIEHFREALRLDPDMAAARRNLERARGMLAGRE